MGFDTSFFNFDNMTAATGVDPFATKTKTYESDDRFYKLDKDEDGKGVAIIRFLPDSERGMIQQVYNINVSIDNNGKTRFVNELSPQTIGKPCPFQEKWSALWNSGNKEEAKRFSRAVRYYANIKVLKDPRNPQNEGKIFLLNMSNSLKDKLQAAMQPSAEDIALGESPKQLFNPLKGNSFKLACKKGANGIITYDPSAVIDTIDSIYESVEDAVKDIKENTYKLSDFLKPEEYMTYDELTDKLNWVQWKDSTESQPKVVTTDSLVNKATTAEVAKPKAEVHEKAQPKNEANLDDLLESLV